MRARLPAIAVFAVLALVGAVGQAAASSWDNDVRLRAGTFSPRDLPTSAGFMSGLELRNRITGSNGMFYGFSYYHETNTDHTTIGGDLFTLEADIKIVPIELGWFHFWDATHFSAYGGAGLGIYGVNAFSGGFSKTAGVQIVGVGNYRVLGNKTRTGFLVFGGVDFFPASRAGLMLEARGHLIQDNFDGLELSTGAVFRF